jgi:hypothetical protein
VTITQSCLSRRERRNSTVRESAKPWSRAWRRAVSRDEARKYAHYNGPAPRCEPVRNDTCQAHHRKLPCKRCPEAGTE